MNDLIERQAAIAYAISGRVRTLPTNEDGENWIRTEEVRQSLLTMPSAQRWIPWDSGRLPRESGTYTVTAYDGSGSRVTFAKYQKRLKRWELTGARAYWRVLAWMEKPEPWKGDTP